MNFRDNIIKTIAAKKSAVCIGLDVELNKLPAVLKNEKDPILKFNKEIIEATKDFVAAYKPNLAFYEQFGAKGIEYFEKTLSYMGEDIIKIADAKRGDIGNTSKKYALAFFEHFNCDAVTVSPYMGEDSISPFLEREDKGVFILALTSNKGSFDFQMQKMKDGRYLYEFVIERINAWNAKKNCGLVVGATHPEMLESIRKSAPDLPYLIPGIGAQGGDLENTVKYGFVKNDVLALINSSRGIIFASDGPDFAERAGEEAKKLRDKINNFLK
ncbi:MAG: orotidine-5'-phosphate decarboxylase [Candidatus Delongbacteria bacterium]|nr:orotidine-5'-phosphate decarboxylase [Candidatus Delongbacteria bacterium]MCG2761390.1 orotidine-5'-phosphate decarboxylase [Candidatus Delongbacteria bacterium]